MSYFRRLAGFAVGVAISVPLLGGWAYWTPAKTYGGDKALLDEAMRLTGRTCRSDQKAADEDGERGRYCEPPAIVEQNLSALNAYGKYDPFANPRVVYVDPNVAKPGSMQWKSTVLHEYVHYLQWLHGDLTPRQNPCKRALLEIEAHEADVKAYPTNPESSKEIIDGYKLIIMLATSEGACT